ncbi:MAG: 50S ribosomal protein L22 [Candidatus Nanoarchaeia archaeon]
MTKYSFQNFDAKSMARIAGRNMPISTKHSVEIARYLRGKQVDKAIKHMQAVIEQKEAIPFRRYKRSISPKPGIGQGRYPRLASQYILALLENLKSQAISKGLDATKLTIIHAAAQKGQKLWHYGRRRRQRKNTNFEMVAKEVEQKKKEEKPVSSPASKMQPRKGQEERQTGGTTGSRGSV